MHGSLIIRRKGNMMLGVRLRGIRERELERAVKATTLVSSLTDFDAACNDHLFQVMSRMRRSNSDNFSCEKSTNWTPQRLSVSLATSRRFLFRISIS
jgi:hypothetical protein